MKYSRLSRDKGIAGLNVFLSLIAMLFMIGIIVMVFIIAGSKLQTATIETTTTSVVNESVRPVTAGTTLSVSSYTACSASIVLVNNASTNKAISAGNYSLTDCTLSNLTSEFPNYWNVTYDFSYTNNPEIQESINATKTAIGTSTDWFATFIVLGAMVVLILLVVIIISSIRGAGITEGA